MSYINALDVSRWQGDINWTAVRSAGYQIAVVKISGGDDGLYYDSKSSQNYYGAKNAGLSIGGYHFAGGQDPNSEAEYFVRGMQPFEENDVFVLDWEIQHPDPVGWCNTFVNRVHELSGVWCLLYVNGSTLNSYDWTPVVANCGVWVAWYGRDPEADLPVRFPYIMHQYSSTGSIPGINGNVDLDAWYYDIPTWNKYGYHAPVTTPEPPISPPIVQPPVNVIPTPIVPETPDLNTPTRPTEPITPPVVPPKPPVVPTPTTGAVSLTVTKPLNGNLLKRIWNAILYFFDIKVKKP